MNKTIIIIPGGIIAGILLLTIIAAVAGLLKVSRHMKEKDKKHTQWFDPRNDRTF